MPREKLHQTLNELHEQLESAGSIDADAREHLREAMADIQSALDKSDPAITPPADEEGKTSVMDRLRDSVEQLEEDHPMMTKTLVELINTLHRMGF